MKIKALTAGVLLTLASLSVSASSNSYQMGYYNIQRPNIVNIYDGDSFKVNLPETRELFGKNIMVRVAGVDTPEINGKCLKEQKLAIKAREFTRKVILGADKVELTKVKRDKYFRLLSDTIVDGENLSDLLINEGLGIPYFGGTKDKFHWCK